MKINLESLYLIRKTDIAFCFFCIGILWAFWSSLMPWFMWNTIKFNTIISCFFIIIAIYISIYFTTNNIFNRDKFALPSLLAVLTLLLMRIVNLNNVIGLVEAILIAFIIFTLLKLDLSYLKKLSKVICISMGGFLSISIAGFLLYLLGFPLPSSPILNEDLQYSYQNYYIFMIDDRLFFAIIPRFNSVFLEPGHLGTATVFLLMTQIGQWKKWYNIVLIITTLITFSLAAYVLFVMVMFSSAWIQHKKVFLKVISIILLIFITSIGAFFYNQGDNLLFSLIIERLEITEDGDIAGNNRVTVEFDSVYDDYVKSSDILIGRDYNIEDFGFGNSGYKVFIYDYGVICMFFVGLFYLSFFSTGNNRRAIICVLLISFAAFLVRGRPFEFYCIIPLYASSLLKTEIPENKENLTAEELPDYREK